MRALQTPVRLHVQISGAQPPELHDSTKLGLSRVPGDIQLVFVPHQDGFVAVLRVPHAAAPAQVRVGRRRLQFLLLLLPDEQRGVPVAQPGIALGQGFFGQGHPPVHHLVSHLLKGTFKGEIFLPAAPKYTPLGRCRPTAAWCSGENIPRGTAPGGCELYAWCQRPSEEGTGMCAPKNHSGQPGLA